MILLAVFFLFLFSLLAYFFIPCDYTNRMISCNRPVVIRDDPHHFWFCFVCLFCFKLHPLHRTFCTLDSAASSRPLDTFASNTRLPDRQSTPWRQIDCSMDTRERLPDAPDRRRAPRKSSNPVTPWMRDCPWSIACRPATACDWSVA